MFKIADGFALRQFGVRVAPDSVLRGGTAVASSPLSAWISGDYGEDNDRNFLEGGVSTQFILRKNSRYPMIVKIPISTAFGEEEYFFGRHFGHASTGVNVRVPLSFISTRYGRWTAGTSAELCYYGTTMAEFVGSIGLQLPRIGAVLSVEL